MRRMDKASKEISIIFIIVALCATIIWMIAAEIVSEYWLIGIMIMMLFLMTILAGGARKKQIGTSKQDDKTH